MEPIDPNPRTAAPKPGTGNDRGWLAAVLDRVPLPALVVETRTGRVVVRNEAARAAAIDLPAGSDPALYATDADGTRVDPGRLIALASGPDGAEIVWHTPDRDVPFDAYARPLPPAGGESPVCVLTFADATRRRAAEDKLRDALEARDEFFSVATHELKDPLFSLQLSIDLLGHTAEKLGPVPPHVRHHLEVSRRQADRLARLIDNLLDVARIENRRLQLDLETFDLADLARDAAGRFQDKAREAGSALGVEAPAPVVGYFDRMKLEQVVANLISNAIKYGAGRPITVRVRGGDETATLEVEDRGVGIAPEDHARVFRRFERASGGHKRESLGLGLYIVNSLVEAHGGAIGLRSEPGLGATFTVTLPRTSLRRGAGPGPAEG